MIGSGTYKYGGFKKMNSGNNIINGRIFGLFRITICFFLLSGFLCGCLPTFQNPIADFENNKIDDRLYGMWIQVHPTADEKKFKDTTEYSFIQILPSRKGVEIIVFMQLEKGYPETMYFSGYPSIINGKGYLNFRFSSDSGNEYYLTRYEILDNGFLKTFHVDEKILKQLIEGNKLRGVIEQNEISVTANKAELLKILESNNLFDTSNPGYFRYKDIGLKINDKRQKENKQ